MRAFTVCKDDKNDIATSDVERNSKKARERGNVDHDYTFALLCTQAYSFTFAGSLISERYVKRFAIEIALRSVRMSDRL